MAAGTWWPSHGADAFRYLCMAYREVAHSEKRPTPIFPAQALSDGQILLHDVNDLDDLPVTEAAEPGL